MTEPVPAGQPEKQPGRKKVPPHAWAAVALQSGTIPPPAVLTSWLARHAPHIEIGERDRTGDDAGAERVWEFAEGQAKVGAAHFPWTIGDGKGAGPVRDHATHVFLSVSDHGRANGREGRRLLARATAAIASTGDSSFIWWGRTGGIYTIKKFVERVEKG
jgi:hypothetical protein